MNKRKLKQRKRLTRRTKSKNMIIRSATAFGSYDELRHAISGGYVPTVSKRKQVDLIRLLKHEGLPYFATS